MRREEISDAIGNMEERYLKEAVSFTALVRKRRPFRKVLAGGLAAAVVLCLFAARIFFFPDSAGSSVTVYAQGTDEKITAAGAVIHTGVIRDSGEMTGHPLMFYLSGKDIETVRFSCRNQQINFMDWTEKREEYGLAKNFTVPYGEDASEYYYLLIDWVPEETIRALTDNTETTIAALPDELREDVIVMQITFADGETAEKAITVSLLEDGTFFAAFDDYEITEQDDFVLRPDSEPVPRDILYGPDGGAGWSEEYPFGDAPVIEGDYQEADPDEPVAVVTPGSITFTGTITDSSTEEGRTGILVEADPDSALPYDSVWFYLNGDNQSWTAEIGADVRIICTDAFQETLPPIGDLISIGENVSGSGISRPSGEGS